MAYVEVLPDWPSCLVGAPSLDGAPEALKIPSRGLHCDCALGRSALSIGGRPAGDMLEQPAKAAEKRSAAIRIEKPNAWLTGTGSRRLEGTNSGHKNAEGMPAVGVRVEPPVRLGSAVEARGVS
jgi:hypothetical protein